MASSQQRADFGFKMMNRLHKVVLRITGGRVLGKPFGMPAVELVTTGRTSGLPRSTMLTSPIHDEQRVVLVASRGGDDIHPQWYRNLSATPEVTLTMEGTTRRMRARTATPAEKEELWPQIVGAYKGYAGYQQKTERDIPVVIFEPV
jgi:deazaflavin-dependent oxidoreductase (nitroreductase family)